MATRVEGFSPGARRVLALARAETQRFNHGYIGTEHILLGLLRDTEGVAARVLVNMGVDPDNVRVALEFVIGRGERPIQGDVSLTPRSQKVIALALDEAHRMSHPYIGAGLLLIGLLREGEGVAAGVLDGQGVTLHSIWAKGAAQELLAAE